MMSLTIVYSIFVLILLYVPSKVVSQITYQEMNAQNNFNNQKMNTFMVQCGLNTIVAISFKGEATSVHSTHDEIHCQGKKVSPLQHIIYNLSRPECGLHIGINPSRATVKIRLQEGNIILGTDKKYSISCVYDKTLSSNSDIRVSEMDDVFMEDTFDDDSFSKTGVGSKTCAGTQKLEILGFTTPPSLDINIPEIEVLFDAENQVILSINTDFGQTISPLKPFITDCIVASTRTPSSFLWKFLKDGCGDGLVVSGSEHFVHVEKKIYELRIKERKILSAMGNITVSCKLAVCTSDQNCSVRCPGGSILDIPDYMPLFMVESRSFVLNETDLASDQSLIIDQRSSPNTSPDQTLSSPTTTRKPATTPIITSSRSTKSVGTPITTTEVSKHPSELYKMTTSITQTRSVVHYIIIGLLSGVLVIILIVFISIIVSLKRRQGGSGRCNFGVIGTAPSWIRSKFWETGSMATNREPPH